MFSVILSSTSPLISVLVRNYWCSVETHRYIGHKRQFKLTFFVDQQSEHQDLWTIKSVQTPTATSKLENKFINIICISLNFLLTHYMDRALMQLVRTIAKMCTGFNPMHLQHPYSLYWLCKLINKGEQTLRLPLLAQYLFRPFRQMGKLCADRSITLFINSG